MIITIIYYSIGNNAISDTLIISKIIAIAVGIINRTCEDILGYTLSGKFLYTIHNYYRYKAFFIFNKEITSTRIRSHL